MDKPRLGGPQSFRENVPSARQRTDQRVGASQLYCGLTIAGSATASISTTVATLGLQVRRNLNVEVQYGTGNSKPMKICGMFTAGKLLPVL